MLQQEKLISEINSGNQAFYKLLAGIINNNIVSPGR
jgi:hypothetical protein